MCSQTNQKYTCYKENFCTSALTSHASNSIKNTYVHQQEISFSEAGWEEQTLITVSASFPDYMALILNSEALLLLGLSCPFTKAINVDNIKHLILSIADTLYSYNYYIKESTLIKKKNEKCIQDVQRYPFFCWG